MGAASSAVPEKAPGGDELGGADEPVHAGAFAARAACEPLHHALVEAQGEDRGLRFAAFAREARNRVRAQRFGLQLRLPRLRLREPRLARERLGEERHQGRPRPDRLARRPRAAGIVDQLGDEAKARAAVADRVVEHHGERPQARGPLEPVRPQERRLAECEGRGEPRRQRRVPILAGALARERDRGVRPRQEDEPPGRVGPDRAGERRVPLLRPGQRGGRGGRPRAGRCPRPGRRSSSRSSGRGTRRRPRRGPAVGRADGSRGARRGTGRRQFAPRRSPATDAAQCPCAASAMG